ncbi:protein-L-isoaspartate O-methyltransferase family protein [Actinomadura violacea]|uniref:Protein-L-isoaspartate O-methyltransferase n=1 Tax=Actinomadura violacea TaxID=2819934 RepID=A0ABS3S7J9_9ACTN|nr:methyltransferase domain-containing protein [Actinomadura violacea]MBO2464977.1 class I SAM-dependent methyltransferase [Actinomadura violacea]
MTATDTIADRLTAYAADLTGKGAIRSEHVASAFAAVPRHLFLNTIYQGRERVQVGEEPDGEVLDRIYSDRSLMTHVPDDEAGGYSSASQPSLVAKMLEALDLEPGMRVLEVGAGTGYNAALIATITDAPVVTIDVSQAVAAEAAAALDRAGIDRVTALHADGYLGHPDAGPYDRIIVTCGVTGASPHWLDQLAPSGLALVPTAHGGQHPLLAITQPGPAPTARAVSHADFMTAAGPLYYWPAHRTRTPTRAVPADALALTHDVGPELDDTDYQALWFHLAAHDPRATRAWTDGIDPAHGLCALHDPDTTATAWIHHDGTAHHTGDPSLLDQLAELVTAWTDTGRHAISDWTTPLEPIGPTSQPVHAPANWHTTR